jgi:hypothetical protein
LLRSARNDGENSYQTKTPASLPGFLLFFAARIYKSINCCMSTSRCGISAYENTMQHLLTDPTLKAALPVIRQGGHPACAISVSAMITRPEGRDRVA